MHVESAFLDLSRSQLGKVITQILQPTVEFALEKLSGLLIQLITCVVLVSLGKGPGTTVETLDKQLCGSLIPRDSSASLQPNENCNAFD